MDAEAQQQVVARLQQANNVLVTVSANPSVDQLAACIGFTLLLNKLGKHGTAVFSGKIPSTLEFLKPEDTLEKNTDSLRDFIIALDKSKADKLRYKVEDQVVRIFITPYRTSLSQKDLEFSQGDFNVDAVVAIGVRERADLDQAIVAHGRILHDATIISVNNKDQGNIGTINWVKIGASSLSEMLVELSGALGAEKLDAQMATAFMTGIVAETNRFSNDKTNPRTMTLASELMSAGANQQLIAAKLDEKQPLTSSGTKLSQSSDDMSKSASDGSLEINHEDTKPEPTSQDDSDELEKLPPVVVNNQPDEPALPKIQPARSLTEETAGSNEDTTQTPLPPQPASSQSQAPTPASSMPSRQSMIMQPPSLGGNLTANSRPEQLDPSTDPLSDGSGQPTPPILSRHGATESLQDARQAVDQAINAEGDSQPLKPVEALGAQPLSPELPLSAPAPEPAPTPSSLPTPSVQDILGSPSAGQGVNPNIPASLMPTTPPTDTTFGQTTNPSAPPPVPPPMLVPTDDSKSGSL